MEKRPYQFTKDYLDCIAQAWIFSVNNEAQVIKADEVVLWIYQYTKKYEFHTLFWKFFWSTDIAKLDEYIVKHYATSEKIKNTKKLKLKLKLPDSFTKNFDGLHEDGITKLNFLALLYGALPLISPEVKQMLTDSGFNFDLAEKKLLKVIKVAHNVEIGPIEFFTTLSGMVDNLKLDVEQMDMFIDMWTITGNDLDAGELIASAGTMDAPDETTSDSSKETPAEKKMTIEYFGTDLTNEAKQGYLDPVIGRDKEIEQMIFTLLRKTKNNPLLIGEAGVGKTAIVEWLAQKIHNNDVPQKLKGKRLFMLDMGSLVAGTKYRGEFESRLKQIIEEAVDPLNNIILFIDEIHTIIGAGNAEWSADAANMLKPLLARGKLQMVGATTFDEYQKHIEKDPALKRRFQELHVEEPTSEVALEILKGIRSKYEEFHGVTLSDEALEKSVTYSTRYMMNKHLPDKAIDLIDEASARVSTLTAKLESNTDYKKTEDRIKSTQKKMEKAIEKQDYFKAAEYKEQEEKLKEKLKGMRQQTALPKHLRPVITSTNIGEVIASKMWIPLDQVTESEIKKIATLDTHIKSFVLGQDEAVDSIVTAIKRNRLSAIQRNKPIGSFLFCGPSGVGKTYIAKLLAKEYFGDDKALIRVDMSEFMEKYSVSKLIGSAPGYVGYEEGGLLTEQVRRKPYSVVLFDEIEKASPDVLNILLQVLDEGHLKDNKGRWIDFKNTIIIMTSNIGSDEFGKKQSSIGFSGWDAATYKETEFNDVKERVTKQVKNMLAPELMNRLSSLVVFRPLGKDLLGEIFKTQVKDFYKQWRASHKWLNLPKFSAKKVWQVIDEIYDPAYGARPIERYIVDTLEPKLIDQVLKRELEGESNTVK